MDAVVIYFLPVQIWEAIGFGIKALVVLASIIMFLHFITNENEEDRS